MTKRTLFDCTAVVTGASSGIGRDIALELARRGAATLILVARRTDRLDALRSELKDIQPGLCVEVRGVDLAEAAQVDRLIAWIANEHIAVDLLVNNAGFGDYGLFIEADDEKNQRMIDVNIAALVRLTRGLLPGMAARGKGSILNVSSTASYLPVPNMAVYAASKAFVTSFSEALGAELDGTGISVTTLCPGPIQTEFHAVAKRGEGGSYFRSPEWFRVASSEAAVEALDAVEGGRPRVIPGLLVCLTMTALGAIPIFMLRHILRRLAKS